MKARERQRPIILSGDAKTCPCARGGRVQMPNHMADRKRRVRVSGRVPMYGYGDVEIHIDLWIDSGVCQCL